MSRGRSKLTFERPLSEGKNIMITKIDNGNPSVTPLPDMIHSNISSEEEKTSAGLNSSDITPENKEEIILTVNKLFMDDLRCPPLTPFSPYNFSCASVTCCVLLNHKKPTQQLSQDDEKILMLLVSEKAWYLLLAPLYCHVTEKNYLSPLLLRALFYGVIDEKQEDTSLRLINILKTHLKLHPPCRKDMREIYHELLMGNIKTGELTNSDMFKYNFNNIIKAIEESCKNIANEEPKEPLPNQSKKEDVLIPSTVEDLFLYISKKYINNENMLSLPEFNYHKSTTEPIENPINSFENLKRLMLIFDLTLDILEENFRMWWMKSRYKLKEKLNVKNRCPLIAEVAWRKSEQKGSITEHCVQVFMLFKSCPAIFRHHLSRYIALLFEVARANEENEDMKFPFFSSLCNSFASELSSHIKENCDLSHDTIDLLQYVYPDWLRFKVGGILLKSDNTSGGIDDLRSVYRILLRNLSEKDTNSCENVSGRTLRKKLKLPNLERNTKDSEGETLIHKYCRTNNLEALRKCLQFPDTNVNLADNAGWTPLHNAAAYNSVGSVKLLVKYRLPPIRGAEQLNIFCSNSENESPLMCATKEGNTEIVNILLKNGAGPTIWNTNSEGVSAVDLSPNDLLKDKLFESWKDSISSFVHLRMNPVEIDILTIMFTSYCSVYHIQDDNINKAGPNKHDVVYKFNYAQFFKDKKTLERLLILVNKLYRIPSNPKNLMNIALCLNLALKS